MQDLKIINGVLCKRVFAKYVYRNGKHVYPKTAKAFCFWVKA